MENNLKCCEKCWMSNNPLNLHPCLSPSCPCHSPHTQETQRADDLIGHNVSGLDSVKRTQESIGELVRDLTKVGSISKSEATRRIQAYVTAELYKVKEEILEKIDAHATEHYHSTAQADIFINLSRAKDIVRKAGE